MSSIQKVTEVRVTRVGQSRPAKTFNNSHPLIKYFRKTANPKRMKKFRMSEALPGI